MQPPPQIQESAMTLVVTSVWIDHLRRPDATLAQLLANRLAAVHDFVLGELASGTLPRRFRTLDYLRTLPRAATAKEPEVCDLLDSHRLWGKGLGWVDLHLLTSARLNGLRLLTADQRLMQSAAQLGIACPVN
jgi:predicted nucleic acid-binding protein